MTTPRNDLPWAAAPPDRRSLQEEMAIQIERGRPDGTVFLDGLSDDELADFALAAQIQAELEAQDGVAPAPDIQDEAAAGPATQDEPTPEPGVIPLRRSARAPRRLDPRWVAIAAVLAGVMLIPFALRSTRGGPVEHPSQAVAMLENPAAGLPAGWADSVVWNVTRGDCAVVPEAGRPARLGAYMVDLELAVRARDADQTRTFAARAICIAEEVEVGALLTMNLRAVAEQAGGEPSALLAQLSEVNEYATDLMDGDRYALGAWAQAARLAVVRRDADFFRSPRTRRTLDRGAEAVGDDATERDAVAAMRTAVEADPSNWEGLRTASDNLLAAVAS